MKKSTEFYTKQLLNGETVTMSYYSIGETENLQKAIYNINHGKDNEVQRVACVKLNSGHIVCKMLPIKEYVNYLMNIKTGDSQKDYNIILNM